MPTLAKTLCAVMLGALVGIVCADANAADGDVAPDVAPALAAAPAMSPAYIGADIGAIVYNSKVRPLNRVYAGYAIGESVMFERPHTHALELMLYSTRLESDAILSPGFTEDEKIRASGIAVSWASALRLNDSWSLTSRLGATYTHSRYTHSYTYGNSSSKLVDHKNSAGVIAAVGANYRLTPTLSATLDVNYMPLKVNYYDKTEAASVSTGLKYHF